MSNESKSFGIISQGLKKEIFLRDYVDENQIFENINMLNGIKMILDNKPPLTITQILITKNINKYKLEINFTINSDDKPVLTLLLELKGYTNLFNSSESEI